MRTVVAWLHAWGWLLLAGVPPALSESAVERVPATGVQLPVAVHCGRVVRLERLASPVSRIDLDRAISMGYMDAGTGRDLRVEVGPQAGKVYAVVTVEVEEGRSIGTFDYVLRVADESYRCLGLGVGGKPYDPRRWSVSSKGEVKLLFEVPVDTAVVSLMPALTISIPLREITGLPLGVGETVLPSRGAVPAEDPADPAVGPPSDAPPVPIAAESEDSAAAPDLERASKPAADPAPERALEPKPAPKPERAADVLDF